MPMCDGGSCSLAGQRGDGGAAGAAVPAHHLQHRPAGLQEDAGEGLPAGLDARRVCRLLLGCGAGAGGPGRGATVLCPRVCPRVCPCLVCILHSVHAVAICSQVSWSFLS